MKRTIQALGIFILFYFADWAFDGVVNECFYLWDRMPTIEELSEEKDPELYVDGVSYSDSYLTFGSADQDSIHISMPVQFTSTMTIKNTVTSKPITNAYGIYMTAKLNAR